MGAWEEDDNEMEEVALNEHSVSDDILVKMDGMHLAMTESISLFRELKIVSQVNEIKELIDTHMKNFPDVFQIQVFEPLL